MDYSLYCLTGVHRLPSISYPGQAEPLVTTAHRLCWFVGQAKVSPRDASVLGPIR
jgi:hypothetical protein